MNNYPLQIHLDQIGFKKSMDRYSNESEIAYKKRLATESIEPIRQDEESFRSRIGAWLGTTSQAIATIDLVTDPEGNMIAADPRIVLRNKKITLYSDYENDVIDAEFDLTDPSNGYFVEDIKNYLDSSSYFLANKWAKNYQEIRSSGLLELDTNKTASALTVGRVRNLGHRYVSSIRPRSTGRFLVEVNEEDIAEVGEYAIDSLNGIVWTYHKENEIIDYVYRDFPFVLRHNETEFFSLGELNSNEIRLLTSERYWGY